MVDRNYWNLLNLKRKIYKTAHSVREAEMKAARGVLEIGEVREYFRFLREENHPKTKKASEIVENALQEIDKAVGIENIRPVLNFCFYRLMELIDETVQEQYFVPRSVKLFDGKREAVRFSTAAILDNLRSPFNVGSVFRTSDSFGVGELALCGITPHPPMAKLERTAMGTIEIVKWKYFDKTEDAIAFYRKEGYQLSAVETAEKSVSLFDLKPADKTAFVFGNEEYGITEDILKLCDQTVEIPQVGMKNSINVANAFAVVMAWMMKVKL